MPKSAIKNRKKRKSRAKRHKVRVIRVTKLRKKRGVKGRGRRLNRRLRNRVHRRRARRKSNGRHSEGANDSEAVAQKGINLFGFMRAEMGIGESGRLAARSLEAANIPFGVLNYSETNHRMDDFTWKHKEMGEPRYNVNLYHLNSDNMRPARRFFGEPVFMAKGRYRIGYWHWELPDFPEEYAAQFEMVNEVWVPTNFVLDSISRKASVPVLRIPHGIEVHCAPEFNRASFGLPEDRFLFFSMYDTQSFQARKNPQAVVSAFKEAFERGDPTVGLVLKLNNPNIHPGDMEVLRQLIDGWDNIYLIASILPKSVVNSLTKCTDCFVSLHRSEGFGLGLAEAMYLGKPVIGTNWSGNTDFMNQMNSCLVSYRLVQVGNNYGPYKAHQFWADPSVQHAASYMQNLVRDPVYRERLAAEGQKTILTEYAPQAIGELMKQRLLRLGLL